MTLEVENIKAPSQSECTKNLPSFYLQYKSVITILCYGIVGGVICFSLGLFILGSVYLYECPVADYIPMYLLILGAFGVVEGILIPLQIIMNSQEKLKSIILLYTYPTLWTYIRRAVPAVFILGSIHIYEIYQPNYDPLSGPYCNKTLYLFTFGMNTTIWAIIFLIIISCLTVALWNCFMRIKKVKEVTSFLKKLISHIKGGNYNKINPAAIEYI